MAGVNTSTVTLGSGELYILDYDGGAIPEDTTLEVEANKIGSIKGGAEVTYSPEAYTVTGDNGITYKSFITKEDVTFKSGILTWNLDVLNKLVLGGELSEKQVSEKTYQVLKIGKNGSSSIKQVVLRFVHTIDKDHKIRMTMIGSPTAGFTLTFDPESETVIDAEFTAMSMQDGTKVEFTMPKEEA